MESTTPCKELMTCTLRYRRVDLDAELTQAVNYWLALDKVLATPVHIEIMNLFIELIGIGKHAIVGCLDIESEDSTAEGTHPSKLVEVLEHNVECLMTAP